MTATLTSSIRRRSCRPASARAVGAGVLQTAADGDLWAIGQICDRHGGALFSVARAVLRDPAGAESVVADVVALACVDADGRDRRDSLRHYLARLIYLRSVRQLSDTDRPRSQGSALARMAELTELAGQQRAAVALVQFGDHTVDEIAVLLGLPVQMVAVLLCAGLRDLEIADQHTTEPRSGLQRSHRKDQLR